MSTQELSSIALRIVGQYQEANKSLVNTYRNGAQRFLDGTTSRRNEVSSITGFLSTRLQADTERLQALIDNVASLQSRGIEDMASRVTQVEQTGAVALFDMLASLQLPQAKLSEQIAIQVAEGVKSLESRVVKDVSKAAEVVADVVAANTSAVEAAVDAVQDLVEPKSARRASRSAE